MTTPSAGQPSAASRQAALQAVLRSAAGLALLLAVLAPLTLWRAHLETSLWMDETYSLLIVSHPLERLLALTGLDAHPPGYYLALKAWLKAGRLVGGEPGVLWARLLGVASWALVAALAWLGGRRLFGRFPGALVAWTVAGGAGAALMAREARGYGLATLGLFGAFLALVAVSGEAAGRQRRRQRWGLWSIFALSATLALWSHLLSALVLAAASIAWLAVAAVRRRLGRELTAAALVGHLVPIVLFSPWLVRVARQIAYIERSDPQWMTPPTWANLGAVFSFWYPFSRLGDPAAPGNLALVPLGVASLLAPLLLALWAARRGRPPRASPQSASSTASRLAVAAAVGLAGSVLYVATLWTLARLDVAAVFHGPRYPLLASHLWSAGLAALAAWAAVRHGVRRRWAVLACAPWLVASLVGQVRMAEAESWGELSALRAEAGPAWPDPGEPLYLLPSELAPFYRTTLSGLDLRRIERLPCDEPAGGPVAVLDANPWRQLDRPRDHLVRALLERGALGPTIRAAAYPADRPTYVLSRVEPADRDLLAELCRRALAPPLRERLAASVSTALPEDQVATEDWSYLEVDPGLDLFRWSSVERARMAFDRPLAPGRYRLHVAGARAPGGAASLGVGLADAGAEATTSLPAGAFELCFDVAWTRRGERPRLVLEHPPWRRAEPGVAADRSLGLVFYAAWIVPVDGRPAEPGCTAAGELPAPA